MDGLGFPERTLLIRRAAARLCLRFGWSPLHEVRLANGRRADILALQPNGGFVCIEVKSGLRDYLTDGAEIYRRSFAIIRAEADLAGLSPTLARTVVRMIHACGMTDLPRDLAASPGAAEAGRRALIAGAPISQAPSVS